MYTNSTLLCRKHTPGSRDLQQRSLCATKILQQFERSIDLTPDPSAATRDGDGAPAAAPRDGDGALLLLRLPAMGMVPLLLLPVMVIAPFQLRLQPLMVMAPLLLLL